MKEPRPVCPGAGNGTGLGPSRVLVAGAGAAGHEVGDGSAAAVRPQGRCVLGGVVALDGPRGRVHAPVRQEAVTVGGDLLAADDGVGPLEHLAAGAAVRGLTPVVGVTIGTASTAMIGLLGDERAPGTAHENS